MSGYPRSLVAADAHRREDWPLPEGVFHLLVADGDLAERALRSRVTVCGAVVEPLDLPPSCFGAGNEIDRGRDPWYCLECVGEAVRWSAEGVGVGCRDAATDNGSGPRSGRPPVDDVTRHG